VYPLEKVLAGESRILQRKLKVIQIELEKSHFQSLMTQKKFEKSLGLFAKRCTRVILY